MLSFVPGNSPPVPSGDSQLDDLRDTTMPQLQLTRQPPQMRQAMGPQSRQHEMGAQAKVFKAVMGLKYWGGFGGEHK